MSSLHSWFGNTVPENYSTTDHFLGNAYINLNQIIREIIQKYQVEKPDIQLVFRCEPLPFLEGGRQQVIELFDKLIFLILKEASPSAKLFLYIDCAEEKVKSSSIKEVNKKYCIKFNTNIKADDSWRNANDQFLIECDKILSALKGTFAVRKINDTGCLFTLSLAGKL